jgi:cytochrome c2
MRAARALLAAALLLPAAARADRYRQGQLLFEQRQCTGCHTVGRQKPPPIDRKGNLDLTAIATVRSTDELRKWLAGPARVNPEARCRAGGLDQTQVNDLIHFFRARSLPAPPAPKPPPASRGAAK